MWKRDACARQTRQHNHKLPTGSERFSGGGVARTRHNSTGIMGMVLEVVVNIGHFDSIYCCYVFALGF